MFPNLDKRKLILLVGVGLAVVVLANCNERGALHGSNVVNVVK